MKNEVSTHSDQPGHDRIANDADKRIDPRCPLVVEAFVAIPSMQSRAYGICEVSRSGMFLAFRDARSTRLELEQNNIGPGTDLEVAFTASQADARYRIRVRARIVRVTTHGIGVQFATRNPPQLAPLRELFPPAGEDVAYTNPQDRGLDRFEATPTRSAPSDTAGWQDWKLVD